jgi:hypothetical protein
MHLRSVQWLTPSVALQGWCARARACRVRRACAKWWYLCYVETSNSVSNLTKQLTEVMCDKETFLSGFRASEKEMSHWETKKVWSPINWRNEETIIRVRTLVRENRRLTNRETSQETGLSLGSVQADHLNMRRASAEFVPRILTDDQKEGRVCTTSELFDRSVCSRHCYRKWSRVTGLGCKDTSRKRGHKAPSGKHHHRHKKARQTGSHVKVMLIKLFVLNQFPRSNGQFSIARRSPATFERGRPTTVWKWQNAWMLPSRQRGLPRVTFHPPVFDG